MSASRPAPKSSSYRPHRCALPEVGRRGQPYQCWCGHRWVAVAGVTIRDARIASMRPDWRLTRPIPLGQVTPIATCPTPYRRPR